MASLNTSMCLLNSRPQVSACLSTFFFFFSSLFLISVYKPRSSQANPFSTTASIVHWVFIPFKRSGFFFCLVLFVCFWRSNKGHHPALWRRIYRAAISANDTSRILWRCHRGSIVILLQTIHTVFSIWIEYDSAALQVKNASFFRLVVSERSWSGAMKGRKRLIFGTAILVLLWCSKLLAT